MTFRSGARRSAADGHGNPTRCLGILSAAFSVTDERYTDLIDLAAYEPLATCDGEVVAWRRQQGSSRVGVDTLGHDVEGYRHPAHASMLASLVEWLVLR
jgi:type 1 glutamine amidotransferase